MPKLSTAVERGGGNLNGCKDFLLENGSSQGQNPALTVLHVPRRERVLYWQPTGPNPHNHRDDFSRPALRHGSLNSLFQVALYLPSRAGYADEPGARGLRERQDTPMARGRST